MAMRHGQVPPTINLEHFDPECDLDYLPDAGRKLVIEHALSNCITSGRRIPPCCCAESSRSLGPSKLCLCIRLRR